MSNKAKAVKKQKKQSKILPFLKKYGLTLVSNGACFEMRNTHWYSAVPIALISLILSAVPISATLWNVQGSQILSNPKNGIDTGLVQFQGALANNKIDILVNGETHTATLPGDSKQTWKNGTEEQGFYKLGNYKVFADKFTREMWVTKQTTTPKDENKKSKLILAADAGKTKDATDKDKKENTTTTVVKKTVVDYNLVVFNLTNLEYDKFHDEIWGSKDGHKKDGLPSILASKDIKGNEIYSTPTLFIGKDHFALARFPKGLQTNTYREFEYSCPSFNLKDLATQDIEGNKYSVTDFNNLESSNIETYYKDSIAAWSQLFDYGYNNQRIMYGWQNAGIWFGINAAVTLVIGLLFFLLTRGKKCVNRDLTFWQSQKIAYWATITPALLALCFGFTKPIYAQYAFLFFMLIRGIWMISNTLNPRVIEEK